MNRVSGLDCVELSNAAISLLVPKAVGPRILSLRVAGGQNLLAELPDFTLDCPGQGKLPLWGGHRLWHGPEWPERTYVPDDRPVSIEMGEGVLQVRQSAEISGVEKTLSIRLPPDQASVEIVHTLTNRSLWPITCAAWAITQLRPGGVAILPQSAETIDAGGFQANRPLALWPYTDINSPHVQWGNRFIFFEANMREGSWKVGFPNRVGWLGYWIDGTLFVKSAEYRPAASYYDFQSSSECYCNSKFLELETLSPQSSIAPGESITHHEQWHLFSDVPFEADESAMAALANRLGLATA